MLLSPLSPDNQPAATPDPTLHTINYDFDLSDFSADNSVADDMLVLPNFLIFTLVGNWAKLVNDWWQACSQFFLFVKQHSLSAVLLQ